LSNVQDYPDAVTAFFQGKVAKGSLFRTGAALQLMYGAPAFVYDVSSQWMRLVKSIAFPTSFCIEAWLRPTANTDTNIDCVVDLRDIGGGGGAPIVGLNCRDGKFNPQWASGSSGHWFPCSKALVLNQWQHVAWQLVNGSQVQIFVNGEKCLDQAADGFTGWSSSNVIIAALADGPSMQNWKLHGSLASVKISSGTPYIANFTPAWDLSDQTNALFYLGGAATDLVSGQALEQAAGPCPVTTRFV
jgi:hypothetical protein